MTIAGHIKRPPPLERALDPIQPQAAAPSASAAAPSEAARACTPSLPEAARIVAQNPFAEDVRAFVQRVAAQAPRSGSVSEDAEIASSDGASFRADAANSSAANASSKELALKRLLEPLAKSQPPAYDQPLAGLALPSPPAFKATHLALRNVAGAYLVDAPCASRPPPHFSISKSPRRSPRSLSPLAKTAERLAQAPAAPAAAAPAVALPAALQQPIDRIRRAASASGVDVQSAVDDLQAALVRVVVEAVFDGSKAPRPQRSKNGRVKDSKHCDSSKAAERSEAAKIAMEDFQDMEQMQPFAAAPSPNHALPPRPATQSSQLTPTPRSSADDRDFVLDLPLQSLKFSSAHQLLSREAAAEAAYKKRMAHKSLSLIRSDSLASLMNSTGLFDSPAAPWPTATLDSWPSNSSARVATSFGDSSDINFLQRENTSGNPSDISMQSPSQTTTMGKLELMRQCSRRPLPQFLTKIDSDIDAALRQKGLPADASKIPIVTASESTLSKEQHQRVSQCSIRTPIFLDALALLGAAFPTYRGLIMRLHGELQASFMLLNTHAKDSFEVCEKFRQLELIHATDLKRERERIIAEFDPSLKRTQNNSLKKLGAALSLQASNAEAVAQRRAKELEIELDMAKESIARLQEAVIFLRQQVDSKNTDEMQLQHAKAIAHLRAIIRESVHRDDYNILKEQLCALQLENAQLLLNMDKKSHGSSTADNSADALAARLQKNNRSVTMKNFGTQTYNELSFKRGKFSLQEIKDMILGVFPGLHVEIEELMASLYGDKYTNSQKSSPTAADGILHGNENGNTAGPGNDENDDIGFQKLFGLVKQSVDQISMEASRAASPQSPSANESGGGKRMKNINSVVRNLKSRDSHRSQRTDEEKSEVPPSERELFAYFKTNGTGKSIPIHLRTNIKLVKNRFFSKRECENMVHQVWRGKDKQKNTGPLDKFLLSYFIQQYGEEMVVMECVYSLVYALKKFKYDPDCDLFLGCLDKLLPQDLRAVQSVISTEVLNACRKRDLRVHKETCGYLSLDDLLRALRDVKIFLYKSDEAFLALQDALALEAEDTSKILYEHLFESDSAGDQCKFAEAVREQSLFEYNELLADLQTAMIVIGKEKNSRNRLTLSKEEMIAQQARHEECGTGSGGDDSTVLVTMEVALSSWHAVDYRVPSKFAETIMLDVFQSRTGQKFPRTPLPVFEVIQELRKVYITRYSKRTDAGSFVAPVSTPSSSLPSIAEIKSVFIKERQSTE